MTTFTDGAPPSVTPEPDDGSGPHRAGEPPADTGPADPDTGSAWLRDEIQRRIAEGAAGSGGRHARRGEPGSSSSAGYVPRHSVATPGPGAPRPAPVGGQMSQASELLRRERTEGAVRTAWSGPPARPADGDPGVPQSPPGQPAGGPGGSPGSPEPAPVEWWAVAPGTVRPGAAAAAAMRGAARGRARAAAAPPVAPAPTGDEAPAGATAPAVHAGPLRAPDVTPAPQQPGGTPNDAAPSAPAATAPAGAAADAPAVRKPAPAGPNATGPAPATSAPGAPITAAPPTGPMPIGLPPTAGVSTGPAPAGAMPASAPPATPTEVPTPGPAAPSGVPTAPQGQPQTAVPPHPTGADPAAAQPTAPVRPVAPQPGGTSVPPASPPGGVQPEAAPDQASDPAAQMRSSAGGITVPEQRGTELRGAPFPRPDTPEDLASKRVRVVLAERKGVARPVRTVVDIQEGTGVGELLRTNLIGSQLAVALRFAIGAGLALGLLPLLFAMIPELGRVEVLGFRLPWLLLGVLVYPFLFGLGLWHTRTAEHVEQNFADHVQD